MNYTHSGHSQPVSSPQKAERKDRKRSSRGSSADRVQIKTHQDGARSEEARLESEATLRILFLGICLVVFEKPHGGVTVVMPDARRRRQSRNDHSFTIPAHHAFMVFQMSDVSPGGRSPDLYIGDNKKYGLCLLDREQISVRGADETRFDVQPIQGDPGTPYDPAWAVSFDDVCPHTTIARDCVQFPPARRVLAHLSVRQGTLLTARRTATQFEFLPPCSLARSRGPRKLAEMGAIDIPLVRNSCEMVSNAFDDAVSCDAVGLRTNGTHKIIQVMIGNAPLADVIEFLNGTPGHVHGQRDYHFELYYDLATRPPAPPYPIPGNDELLPRVGACPYGIISESNSE